MDSTRVEVRETGCYGKGVFAKEELPAGELIASFDGEVYIGGRDGDAPNDPPLFINDHAIQFEPNRLRDSAGIARLLNHSCSPNCGIVGLFDLVTMREVDAGEELTWDYAMSEDSDWSMTCECGSPGCRGEIKGYRFLPQETRERYAGYISEWLIQDYGEG